MQAELVGEAAGERVAGLADQAVRIERAAAVGAGQAGIVAAGGADEHAGAPAVQLLGRQARILDGVPRHFEQQALLRIELRRLARAEAEEGGIELLDVVDEARGLHRRRHGLP